MTEIIVATISAVALIVVAVINVGLRRRVKAIQGQVQNDHETNLREELDLRHGETGSWFADLRADFREFRRDIGGIRDDIRGIRKDHRALAERVASIEKRGLQS